MAPGQTNGGNGERNIEAKHRHLALLNNSCVKNHKANRVPSTSERRNDATGRNRCRWYPRANDGKLILAAEIADSSSDFGCWYRAPGWPAAARNQRQIPAAADPFFTGQHLGRLV
jgi:hypothetical protein